MYAYYVTDYKEVSSTPTVVPHFRTELLAWGGGGGDIGKANLLFFFDLRGLNFAV